MRKFSNIAIAIQPPTTSLSEFELTVKSVADPGQQEVDEHPFKYLPIQEADPFLWRAKNPRLNTSATILVVVTMYNEGGDELLLTLRAIAKNVKQMTRRLRRPTFWQSIAVVIVSDGRSKASSSTLQLGKELGILNASVMEKSKPTTQVHLFESIVKMVDNETRGTRFPPLQVVFAMKERNSGKLNSHLWFFEGVAHVIQPKYTFLLDVGTVPRELAFLGFYNELENNDNVAGCCGRLTTRSNHPIEWLNPVISAQRFEYQVSSLLDLSFQSILGYLAVLPGAFSAYRYDALRGEPLRRYFSQLGVADRDLNPFVTNMTLAEDRLLCYELISKKDCSYTLSYVNTSVAETDVPSDLVALLKQRRRWLNGSLFALLYALGHFFTFWSQSGHNLYRKFCISFLYFFFAISVLIQWLAMGMFFLVIVLVSRALGVLPILYILGGGLFVGVVIVQFVLSIQNRPQDLRIAYNFTSAILTVITIGLLFLIVQFAMVQFKKGNILLMLTFFIAWGVYLAAGLLHGAFVAICLSLLPFIAMTPAFLIVFPIFALSNTHDVSWGTKDLNTVAQPSDEATKEIVRRRFLRFRTIVVGLWLLSNIVLVILVFYFNIADAFLLVTILSVLFLNGARFLGSVLYLTGGSANSSLFVKFFVSPITFRAYMALLKLPVSILLSVAYLFIMVFSFFIPEKSSKKLIHSISSFDIQFTHALSSRSTLTKKALASLEVRKEIHYVVENEETRRLDMNKNRRYFLLVRWTVTAIIAAVWIMFVNFVVILASNGRSSVFFRCATSCISTAAKLNVVPFHIPALVAALFMLNSAWAGDDILRILVVKMAPIQ